MASSSQALSVDAESIPLLNKKQVKVPSPYYAVVCALALSLASGYAETVLFFLFLQDALTYSISALMAPKMQFYTDIFCHR